MFRTLKSWLTAETTGRTQPKPQLSLTALEAREVPATVTLAGGVLTVTGDNTSEGITVCQNSAYLWVGGLSGVYPTSQVSKVVVDAKGGDDFVRLDTTGYAVSKPAHVFGGDGNDVVYGGSGNDYLDGQVGDDIVAGFGGADRVVGDIGDDDLYGGEQDDVVVGGLGADYISGGSGWDQLEGGQDADDVRVDATDYVYGDQTGDTVSGSTAYNRRFGESTLLGWFDLNMNDGSTRRTARPTVLDGWVDRKDMIAVLEHVGEDGGVSTNELNSIRNFTASVPTNVRPEARDLGMNVTHGDPANRYWTGGTATRTPLGNLAAGSSASHLNHLIDKWFRGADLPMAKSYERDVTFGYQQAAGSLFVGGPSVDDVDQGRVGDCYLLAGLGAVARQNPDAIRQMITDNGDGTFTVRFYDNGVAKFVTVNRQLPVNSAGRFVFANDGDLASSSTNELWVALVEKAYAQVNESGWIGQDNTNSYNGVGGAVVPDMNGNRVNTMGINGGGCGTATTQITGRSETWITAAGFTFDRLRAEFDAGKAVVFNTPDDQPPRADVVKDHCYTMTGYDAVARTITLRNPWGDTNTYITLSMADLQANFTSAEFILI